MKIEKGFVKKIISKIVGLEKYITDFAIHSKNLKTYDATEKLLSLIEEKNNLVLNLKIIKGFMQELSGENVALFSLYFVKGVDVSKLNMKCSMRQRFRKIAKLRQMLEEKLL